MIINDKRVQVDLIPPVNSNRPQVKMTPISITIHETGNPNKGANAEAHAKYLKNTSNKVSWHFTVDDEKIVQHLPINEIGWHAGNSKGNSTSIGIEICVNSDGDFEKAKLKAKELIAILIAEVGDLVIVPHKHWTGKNCPRNILKEGWNKFMSNDNIYRDMVENIRNIIGG